MSIMEMKPIGYMVSPIESTEGAPIQPSGAVGMWGQAHLEPEFVEGLEDLDGFTHLVILYSFHLSEGYDLTVKPFLDDSPRGLFATRAPRRPNPIGLSVVRLHRVEGQVLHLLDVDMVDGTPILDIKPYIPAFDSRPEALIGWMTGKDEEAEEIRSDDRFQEGED